MMSGIWTKQDQEWWDNKENQFIFNFNLLFTSGDYWERTPENVKPREEALRKLYRENCRHEPQVMPNEVLAGGSCWQCREFEQHTNQRLGYCHKYNFDAKTKIAKTIKCNDFIHYNDKSQREA